MRKAANAAAGRSVPKVHEVLQAADHDVVADQVKGCELFEMLSRGPIVGDLGAAVNRSCSPRSPIYANRTSSTATSSPRILW